MLKEVNKLENERTGQKKSKLEGELKSLKMSRLNHEPKNDKEIQNMEEK